MYFINDDHRAFESLMRDKPGDHYDSGADGPFPECLGCRCCRPQRKAKSQNRQWLISAKGQQKGLFSYENKPFCCLNAFHHETHLNE